MARLTMVAPPDLAVGFRLAGADVVAADDSVAAQAALEALSADPEVGVIGIYAPFFDQFNPATRRAFEDSVAPVVIAVPLGAEDIEPGEHRARLASLLRRAIGYRISFGEGEDG